MYVASAKTSALHETQTIRKVKTSELNEVTAAITPFYFQLSHYFLKFLNQGKKAIPTCINQSKHIYFRASFKKVL